MKRLKEQDREKARCIRKEIFLNLDQTTYSSLFGIECIRLCKESWCKTSVGRGKTNL